MQLSDATFNDDQCRALAFLFATDNKDTELQKRINIHHTMQ